MMEFIHPKENNFKPGTIFNEGVYYFSVQEFNSFQTGEQLVRMIGFLDDDFHFHFVYGGHEIYLRDLNSPQPLYEPPWTACPYNYDLISL